LSFERQLAREGATKARRGNTGHGGTTSSSSGGNYTSSSSSAERHANDPIQVDTERQRKLQEAESYDAMIRAKDFCVAPSHGTKLVAGTHSSSKLDSPKVASRGLHSFASLPNRERHYLSKFDGPVGLRSNAHIDYYTKVEFNYKLNPNKNHTLDIARQTQRKAAKMAESASLTYDVKFPADHVSAIPMQRVAKRAKVFHMLQNDQDGDPAKYLPDVHRDSRKGAKAKLINNFARDTDRTKVKHLHPRVNMNDLSYSAPSDFDQSHRKGGLDIFLSSSRKVDSKRNVVKSVDWLLGCLDRDLKSIKRSQTPGGGSTPVG